MLFLRLSLVAIDKAEKLASPPSEGLFFYSIAIAMATTPNKMDGEKSNRKHLSGDSLVDERETTSM